MGDLNPAGSAQQHDDVRRSLQLGGQHAHIGQHDAQGGDDAGGLAVTGAHDLRHRDLVGLADLAGDEIQQDDADGRRRKGDETHPGAAGVHHAGGAGDSAAAAPSSKQCAHQDDEGDAVAAGHHVIRGLDFLPGHDQPEDREQHQIGADRNNVSHIFSFSSHNRIIKRFYSFRGIMSSCIPSGVCAGIRTRQFFSGFLSKSVVSCPRGERHDIQGCGEPHH